MTFSNLQLLQLLPIAILVFVRFVAAYDWQWRPARATAFGDNAARNSYCRPEDHDVSCWSIHKGNCGYGYIFPDEPSGWDIAAMSDQFSDFSGSCGRCVEVKCDPTMVKDGYGSRFDRKSVCRDPSASIVVRIVDACPCNYPKNYYSNKRWCCGDAYHLDLSIWAFEKLADKKWGIIGLQYRSVPCSYTPAKKALPVANPTPGQSPPPGAVNPMWNKDAMSVPSKKWSSQQSGTRYQAWNGSPASSGGSSRYRRTAQTPSGQGGEEVIFGSQLQNGWWDRSWKAQVNWSAGKFGPQSKPAACATIYANGALSVRHNKGAFQGQGHLEFYVQSNKGVPDISVNIGSNQKRCSAVKLSSLSSYDNLNGWNKYQIPLSQFGNRKVSNFDGCGGMGSRDITDIEFKNHRNFKQGLCMSQVRLVA